MADKNYITFIDNSGRALFAEKESETDTTIVTKNPVMITVQQQQNGQMAVQLFPLFFQEFVVEQDGSRHNFFTYNKDSIAIGSGFQIEPRIIEQYDRIVNPQLVPNNNIDSGGEPENIKLFDE